jgi:hypothetical protein
MKGTEVVASYDDHGNRVNLTPKENDKIFEMVVDSDGDVLDQDPTERQEYRPVEIVFPEGVSGFDFPLDLPIGTDHKRMEERPWSEGIQVNPPNYAQEPIRYPHPRAIVDPEAYEAGEAFDMGIQQDSFDRGIGHSNAHVEIPLEGFNPKIYASQLDFGAGMPQRSRNWKAEYLEAHGREDEAYERDE